MNAKKTKEPSIDDLLGDDLLEFTSFEAWPAWSTGIPFLDVVTGIGGLPKGRIVENFGVESSGKSTMFLKAAAKAQADGEKVVLLDYENAFDPAWAQFLGIDVNGRNEAGEKTFYVAVPETMEKGFEIMDKLIRRDDVAIIIIDSLAAMVPAKQLEPDFNLDRAGMYKAKQLRALLSNLNTEMAKHRTKTTLGVINQVYEDVSFSPGGGKKYNTPGGRAMKFYASMRIEFKKVGTISEDIVDEIELKKERRAVAHKIRATVVKNKVGAPFKRTQFICREGYGIDVLESVYDLAVTRGLIEKSGAWFTVPAPYSGSQEPLRLHGKANVMDHLRTNTAAYQKLENDLMEALSSSVSGEETESLDGEGGEGLEFIE
ncbi:MAG: hypothetical protein NWE76_01365 [Candidatus Bathyarchaeota archaeon]|nr:hypothetical protein [Candidatus Bathyarchaeota archaeon]